MPYKDILLELVSLSKIELQKLQIVINTLIKEKEEDRSIGNEEEVFYRVLAKNLEMRGNSVAPFFVFKKTQYYPKFCEAFSVVAELMQKYNTKVSSVQWYNLYYNQILIYLDKFQIPVTLVSLINCYNKFVPQLHLSFPGYFPNFIDFILKE